MLFNQYSKVLKMANTAPTAITIIGVALVVIASLIWRRRREGKLEEIRKASKNKVAFAQWITGIVSALVAVCFMFDGDTLGENTTGISTVMSIVGICLIGTSNTSYYLSKHDKGDWRTKQKSLHKLALCLRNDKPTGVPQPSRYIQSQVGKVTLFHPSAYDLDVFVQWRVFSSIACLGWPTWK